MAELQRIDVLMTLPPIEQCEAVLQELLPELDLEERLPGVAGRSWRAKYRADGRQVVARIADLSREGSREVAEAEHLARSMGISVAPPATVERRWNGLTITVRPFVEAGTEQLCLRDQYSAAGQALARIHMTATTRWRATIYDELAAEVRVAIEADDSDVRVAAGRHPEARVGDALARRSIRGPVLTHGDLSRANWIPTDGAIVIVDWDYASALPPGLDLAFTLVHACAEPLRLVAEAWHAVLRAYIAGGCRAGVDLVEDVGAMADALLVHDWYNARSVRDGRLSAYLEEYVRPTWRHWRALQADLNGVAGDVVVTRCEKG